MIFIGIAALAVVALMAGRAASAAGRSAQAWDAVARGGRGTAAASYAATYAPSRSGGGVSTTASGERRARAWLIYSPTGTRTMDVENPDGTRRAHVALVIFREDGRPFVGMPTTISVRGGDDAALDAVLRAFRDANPPGESVRVVPTRNIGGFDPYAVA